MSEKPVARYQSIAYEIAKRIRDKELKINDKLRGRSVLASEYSVSSETIRKAMRLLSNAGVVEVKERSGIYVKSIESACEYIESYNIQHNHRHIVEETQFLLEQAKKVQSTLEKNIKQLAQTAKNDGFPFEFFIINLTEDDRIVGKRIKDTDLNTQTNGLIIAIEDDGVFNQNPSNTVILKTFMKIYILGNEIIKNKVTTYIGRK